MFDRTRHVLAGAGAALHQLSRAQARWELDASRTILARRKKLLLLALAPVALGMMLSSAWGQPTQPVGPAAASAPASRGAPSDALPKAVPVLGGSKALMPVQVTSHMFLGSVLVGLVAGLITGVIGAGGGYILTPALMSFGVRGIMSVGTDQFHLFAKAIMGTAIHRKLGNVNLRLAVWFVVGSLLGVTAGGTLSRAIFQYSPALSDAVISLVYVVVLGLLGAYAILDWARLRKAAASASSMEATTGFAKWLQRLPLKPRVAFDEAIVPGGRSISVYPVIACGLIVGFVAAIMGVGGGFLTFPMFVYGMGVSTFTTVGTDILQIIFTTAYSSIFQYAIYGFVFYTVAIGMLIGSLVGVQIGAMITKMVKGSQIRAFYALTILAGFFNRLCALPRKLADMGYVSMPRQASVMVENVGVWLFFGMVGLFSLWILAVFVRHLLPMRTDRQGMPIPAGGPWVVDRPKLALGLTGLAVFAVVLAIGTTPAASGNTVLAWADTFFNQLAKHSVNHVAGARTLAAKSADALVDIGITPREHCSAEVIHRVVSCCGAETTLAADGRIRIRGTMGQLCDDVLTDADLAFQNDLAALEARHGVSANNVLYSWWIVFDGLARRYVQENRPAEAELAKFVSAKVLEPAYNFRGIPARSVKDNVLPLIGMLAFYLVYTCWYGCSIMLVFEGFGITATVTKGRRER